MDAKTAEILCKLNNDFYRTHCASFSETRKAPWPGWKRCLEVLRTEGAEAFAAPMGPVALVASATSECPEAYAAPESPVAPNGSASPNVPNVATSPGRTRFSVLDLACGNLRFEAFLESEVPQSRITFHAVDNCESLVPFDSRVEFQSLDIMESLLDGKRLGDLIAAGPFDLSVSFGFLHHVPGIGLREQVLASLVEQTRSGGYAIVSLWQFLNDDDLAAKAAAVHARALGETGISGLDEGDFLLGWKSAPGAYRYCHSFSDAEVDHLVESIADHASPVARFKADGRTGNLNSYIILRVR